MLTPENTILVMIDIQEKLARAMLDKEVARAKCIKDGERSENTGSARSLRTEQNPNGLGRTVPELEELLHDVEPITKLSFSCCGEPRFMERIAEIWHVSKSS